MNPSRFRLRLWASLVAWAWLALLSVNASEPTPLVVDFRYAPPVWQTAICLPDDWQKTLVSQDGALLYDYPGKFGGFGTRITFGALGGTEVNSQWLQAPAVPIVHTVKRAGTIRIEEDAFAVAPPRRAAKTEATSRIERVGIASQQTAWADAPDGADPAFDSVDIGWNQPLSYRYPSGKGNRCKVVFGLCEGFHPTVGRRVLELRAEGAANRTVDPVAERGRNQPVIISLNATDENRDGWIEIAIHAAPQSPDANTILNALWIFPAGSSPDENGIRAGTPQPTPLAFLDCGAGGPMGTGPRHDVLLVHLTAPDRGVSSLSPILALESEQPIRQGADLQQISIGGTTTIFLPQPFASVIKELNRWIIQFPETSFAPGERKSLAFGVLRGPGGEPLPTNPREAESLRRRATRYWEQLDLPYDTLQVPDVGIQALLTSSIRNIYQAREIKQGLPAFQVGPTCYRGLWVVDGSFILEAVAFLGRSEEARRGVEYLLGFQRPDGAFMLIDGHWKETGIALWAVTRHARLTGDPAWLRSVWPKVRRGFAFIQHMRSLPPTDAPNAGLIPDGFSDGGLADRVPEYTNIYWTRAGMKAAVDAARWLGEHDTADAWQRETDDFSARFRAAAKRDTRTDPHGNRYVPTRMNQAEGIPPQKAQWAFLHAVFPGKVFPPHDPLVQGNMAMLRATETQDMVQDTGWLKDGIWNYFGSFYAHAWLWLGDGPKASQTLYAFANHASPLLVWREEHLPAGRGTQFVGDMPHNWASAEFIRLVRHCLILERGADLNLLEAIPPSWLRPSAVTRVQHVATEFGPVSLELTVNRDGSQAELRFEPPRRNPPGRILLHLGSWSAQPGVSELPTTGITKRMLPLRKP